MKFVSNNLVDFGLLTVFAISVLATYGLSVFIRPLQFPRRLIAWPFNKRPVAPAWVNDDNTKRAYESSDDVYRVFRKMLKAGSPPDD